MNIKNINVVKANELITDAEKLVFGIAFGEYKNDWVDCSLVTRKRVLIRLCNYGPKLINFYKAVAELPPDTYIDFSDWIWD